MELHYVGEHLVPGIIGKGFIWLGFFAAIGSAVSFYLNGRSGAEEKKLYRHYARILFGLHTFSLLAVVFILYYLIFSHYFEYSYVWQYSSMELPGKYIISCFWAGQEGSILIWAVFQALIGAFLLFRARKWEDHVMSVVALSQILITSMLLGIHLGSVKIGGSPFELLRETVADISGTIFQQADYIRMIGDGNGLNPLLENIWMTIHPPILFLGYALSLVPFAYAIASLAKKDFYSWIRPALPWVVVALTVLGAGILLGGAWAYVSLTFGGFWSWDPVENSSLVPWLTLVAGLHFLIIAKKQNHGLIIGYIFICLTYVLVLYASFLTRSGILANSSAHSFGDNGMTVQLLVYLLLFLLLMLVVIFRNIRNLRARKEEILLSREFFMLVGGLVIILAAFQILFTTSIPVFNALFDTNAAPPADKTAFYNRWQLPYVVLVAGFIAFSQFLSYRSNSPGGFLKKMTGPAITAILLTVLLLTSGAIRQLNYALLAMFALFALTSSVTNLLFSTSRPKNYPAIVTHIGFVIFILGTVLTFSNSKIISTNTSKFDLGDLKSNAENLMLVKGDTLNMGEFYVVYSGNRKIGNTTDYKVDFMKMKEGKFIPDFSLFPSVNRHPRMGNVYNPDTKHFLREDFYTYIAYVSNDPDYIVIKAIKNPLINILWLGAILMISGSAYAWVNRLRPVNRVQVEKIREKKIPANSADQS
jgi:cytochrome c-type biogenesis protein CcmF